MPPLTAEDVQTWGKARVEQEMRDRLGDVQSIREKNDGSLANVKGDEVDRVRQHNSDLNTLGERKDAITELERADADAQKLQSDLDTPGRRHRHGGPDDAPDRAKLDTRSAGTIFSKSNALKMYREDGIKGVEADVPISALLPQLADLDLKGFRHPSMKATLGESNAVATEYPVQSIRVGVLVDQLFQQPNIGDLFPQTTIDQPAVPFMRETVNATGAAETAEGAAAPEASLSFTEDSAPVRKIPVILPVTEEILEDEGLVEGHVNNRLPQFISMREDSQLLNGDGTGQNLQGILGLSGIDATTTYSIATATAQDKLESVFKALMKVSENFLLPDAAVMGLGIWELIRLAKNTQGTYLLAPSADEAAPRVWGLRVVNNQNMPAEGAGNHPIVVGAFAQASQIWRRRAITLQVSDSHNDNFGKGILVIKATSRLAVTHYRAAGYAVVVSNA